VTPRTPQNGQSGRANHRSRETQHAVAGRVRATCTVPAAIVLAAVTAMPASAFAQSSADPLRRDRLASDEEIAIIVPAAASGPEAAASAPEAAVAYPLRSLVSDDYSDLEFLREELRGVRIVQLGESGHGMGETAALKSRLVRFLHQELGFEVLALESDLYQCADADQSAGQDEATLTIFKCAFGVWHIEEIVPMFEHIRASRRSDHPLRLAGFDVQPIGRNKHHRPAFLADLIMTADSVLAAQARSTDSLFLAVYAEGSRARRAYFRENRDALLGDYERYAAALDEVASAAEVSADAGAPALRRRALLGAQTVRSIMAYIRQQTAADRLAYAEARNLGMAENVRFLAESFFPGRRIIVWGHNTHVRHASESVPPNPDGGPSVAARDMGSWLMEWYGDELYTVGFYAFHGSAVDNSRQAYEVPAASPAHLEHRLARAGYRIAFFDLRRQRTWATREQTLRYNGLYDQVLVPGEQYDALVLIVDVGPPHFLY
jgi:erythromycin esterase